ncbi:MAG TPA: discoidin domain-containing protein [Thermoguttaceae bacterium]|nr:discoidin domain-containing protein [Thermoguttaceae bacterium]
MRARWRIALVQGSSVVVLAAALMTAVDPAEAARPVPADGRAQPTAVDVGESLQKLVEADWADQDRRFVPAGGKAGAAASADPTKVNQYGVTTAQDASGGCDGVKNGRWGFHVASGQKDPWWQVDLQEPVKLDRVVVFNRMDTGKGTRTKNIRLLVAEDCDPAHFKLVYKHEGEPYLGVKEGKPLVVELGEKDVTARVVRLAIPGNLSFALDEIEVYGVDDPKKNIALGKPADQISVSRYSYPGTLPEGVMEAVPPPSAGASGGFTLAHTRAVVDRAHQLAARLRTKADANRLGPLEAELGKLEERLAKLEAAEDVPEQVRRELYLAVRGVVRRIAFTNPLLDVDKLLFIKRHDSTGVFHMCDQYYGCNAKPGGGLFVLENPFGPNPKLVNLLKDSVVEEGRLKGQKLEGGTFLSPEVSFDGRTILFAYTEAKAWAKYQGKEAYEWGPEISYHIFKSGADGSGLVQLTGGPCDDFDPCFLPNGRIAFISERRGGYLRCGRHCPVYALFSMRPDGSDVINLSYHETHEWHPSVTNDGMLVYSRWDYVDRDTNIAHHIWTCYPDGRDARSFHGNYPEKRESRPWMEMSIRAIPNSNKFVASTGAHHGNAFGSLVLIDHRLEDDGAMSQLVRLTPEVPFAESEGRPIKQYMVYGTPWPLSEEDYLCVYDPNVANRGIYWIDRFGNKELIYRDPEISCLSPIPLRPRTKPPVIPTRTSQAAEDAGRARQATVAVMNVYDSDFEWPEETKIADLRIVQLLPKSTAPPNQPRIGVANQTNARAVLGTVPVEPDGSVFFEAPAGKALYFQALDETGLAVQSMRSLTYLHEGERLSCQGCHERKHRPPPRPTELPLALGRPPSKIRPDVDGSNPFNYVRLVQPALDRNCVKCHQEKKALDLTGVIEGGNGWTRSYTNLAGKYGFYFHVHNGAINTGVHGGTRTIAGQFGAKAAPLLSYLGEDHYGVKFSDEDFHRLALWLDCNSEFYGTYENTEAQARGEVVRPTLE